MPKLNKKHHSDSRQKINKIYKWNKKKKSQQPHQSGQTEAKRTGEVCFKHIDCGMRRGEGMSVFVQQGQWCQRRRLFTLRGLQPCPRHGELLNNRRAMTGGRVKDSSVKVKGGIPSCLTLKVRFCVSFILEIKPL